MPIAETTCITVAVAGLVARLYVFNIENPKDCKHFPSFISSYLLGIKYGKGETQKSKSLMVKLNEIKMAMSYKNA